MIWWYFLQKPPPLWNPLGRVANFLLTFFKTFKLPKMKNVKSLKNEHKVSYNYFWELVYGAYPPAHIYCYIGKIIHWLQGKYQERAHSYGYEIYEEKQCILLICSLKFLPLASWQPYQLLSTSQLVVLIAFDCWELLLQMNVCKVFF